ncbi:hypothetical protein DBZ36_02175 [Alginatibacterium sediminis]|uniref:Uncharacterized protein n=1 Tax=Alginatibacterium sediminis TaxID=2164068 RepID=A0A420ELA8_9ALTE|nr:hypothetical protein [Alginatibacterium sediminis]RKF21478.1 hypothetical protein DBZ36_02175 [Alginatibacterium sediminis]
MKHILLAVLLATTSISALIPLSASAQIVGDHREDRRDDRQDTREVCRDQEGHGKDKRDCKQDAR